MNDQLMSLTKIFTDRLFRIPDYQRGYAWREKEISDYWNDLCSLHEENNHYVGVLTLEPVNDSIYKSWIDDIWLIKSKKYQPYYVVDGQQRLTTSILLIKAIIHVMRKRNIQRLNYSNEEEICKRFIYQSKDENNSNSYLFSYEQDNPSYNYLIDCIYHENKEKSKLINETTYTSNLEFATMFFKDKLELMNDEDLEFIYTKITQHFLFNTYEISSDIDVYVTFETMNNRGKPLSQLELLKNRLIYLATLFDIDYDVKERLRRDINSCWKDIYHSLGRNKENKLEDDDFLNAHFQLYFCKVIKDIDNERKFRPRRRYLHYEYLLHRYFVPNNIADGKLEIEKIFEYIKSLNKSIIYWEFINNPDFSNYNSEIQEYLRKINYIIMSTSTTYNLIHVNVKVLLLACLQRKDKDENLLKLLKVLEQYLFLHMFIPYQCSANVGIDRIDFQELIIKLDKGDITLVGIKERFDRIIDSFLTSQEINSNIIKYYEKNGFYEADFLRYFLCEYEVSLMKESRNNAERLNRDILFRRGYDSIEHIYPRNAHSQYWIKMFNCYTPKQKTSLKNSLGNFLVISQSKNGKLGNKSFAEKKGNLQNALGYRNGTYAEIELTNYDDWSSDEILKRGLKLVAFLQKRWNVKIGETKEDRKRFLGLSFL